MRVFAIATALRHGFTVEQIHDLTKIDRWFLEKLRHIVETGKGLEGYDKVEALPLDLFKKAKRQGFSRGFITAVDRYKNAGFETDLEIIRGDRDKDAVLADIKDFKPSLIITTADKDYPAYLNEYAKENYAMVVNPFDLKSEGFLTNPAAIQLMPPSTQFNESVARYILDNFEDRKMVIVSSNIEDDLIANLVADQTDSSRILQLTLRNSGIILFYETEKYIVYATPTKRATLPLSLTSSLPPKRNRHSRK